MKIGFLGDSITLGYGLENKERDRFTRLVSDELGMEERNFGITGTLVAKAGPSCENGTAYVDRIGQLRGVDFAVIFGGTNDYFWTDTEISSEEDKKDVQYFTNAVYAILQTAREFLPDNKILFVTPYPHHGIGNFQGGKEFLDSCEHDTTVPNFVGRTLDEYCDELVRICSLEKIQVLDLRKPSDAFVWREMTTDGCHPNPEGHRWLAKQIGEKIRKMLKE